jgi:hypothetical protein
MGSLASSLAQAGDEAVGNAQAINEKAKEIQQLKDQGPLVPQGPAAPQGPMGNGTSSRSSVGKSGKSSNSPIAHVTSANPGASAHRVPGQQRASTLKIAENASKPLGSFKKGGKVKKTGVYKLHVKERVLNAKQSKKVEKAMKELKGVAAGLSK